MFQVDLSALPGAVQRELIEGQHARNVLALHQAGALQREVAAAAGEHRTADGLGQLKLRITPDAYHFWGQRLGYDCWKDKQFLREFARDNEACRVQTATAGNRVGWTPAAERSVRYSKKYEL